MKLKLKENFPNVPKDIQAVSDSTFKLANEEHDENVKKYEQAIAENKKTAEEITPTQEDKGKKVTSSDLKKMKLSESLFEDSEVDQDQREHDKQVDREYFNHKAKEILNILNRFSRELLDFEIGWEEPISSAKNETLDIVEKHRIKLMDIVESNKNKNESILENTDGRYYMKNLPGITNDGKGVTDYTEIYDFAKHDKQEDKWYWDNVEDYNYWVEVGLGIEHANDYPYIFDYIIGESDKGYEDFINYSNKLDEIVDGNGKINLDEKEFDSFADANRYVQSLMNEGYKKKQKSEDSLNKEKINEVSPLVGVAAGMVASKIGNALTEETTKSKQDIIKEIKSMSEENIYNAMSQSASGDTPGTEDLIFSFDGYNLMIADAPAPSEGKSEYEIWTDDKDWVESIIRNAIYNDEFYINITDSPATWEDVNENLKSSKPIVKETLKFKIAKEQLKKFNEGKMPKDWSVEKYITNLVEKKHLNKQQAFVLKETYKK